jgi:hypothetical protein
MRTLRASMGAATGNQRGTKGMPEVQKPVLEHAPSEAQNPQVTGDTLAQNSAIDKGVTSVTAVRNMDRMKMTVECSDPGVVAVFRAAQNISPEPTIQRDIILTAARWAEFLGTRLDSYTATTLDNPAVAELAIADRLTIFS